ncbi:DUF6252 family protein [Polluticoccus soli]|uniref:DUF6252 family protein n=1 Tax=Polluticoccus soli TaxID=3034150 RepID=UPI0023E14471|nr:DUF6252 family protein [Flavipsychrobacter sp. JY13-12]
MNRFLSLIIASITLFFSSCEKFELSPTDEEYMTCKIDGNRWRSDGSGLSLDWTSEFLTISGYNDDGSNGIIISVYEKNIKSGTYPLNGKNIAWYDDLDVSTRHGWKADSVHTGSITIKVDDANRKVSGTFSFKAKYDEKDDVVDVTQGSFFMKK